MNPRRLYRSRSDRQLAGVAGGIAEYLDVDPTVVRLLWILSIFFGGFGLLVYIIMAFIVPLEPAVGPAPGWGPGGPAWGAAPTVGTAAASAGTSGPADAEPATEPAPETGADNGAPAGAAPTWDTNPAWAAPGAGWQPPAERRPGRGGVVVGVLLVVFGSIALAGTVIPGWVAWPALGPVFLVALGVALLVGAARRTASAS